MIKNLLGMLLIIGVSVVGAADDKQDKKSAVFILGSKHLYSLRKEAPMSVLDKTIDALAAYNPELIAIEKMPPLQLHAMAQEEGYGNKIANDYNRFQLVNGQYAQKALNNTFNQAYYKVNDLRRACPKEMSRPDCVLTLTAAYDAYSGLLQWNYMTDVEKAVFETAHKPLAEAFTKMMGSSNEIISVGLRLAIRLKHDRLYPVDNHTEKSRMKKYFGSQEGNKNPWSLLGEVKDHPYLKEMNAKYTAARDAGDLLPFFKWMNLPSTGLRDEQFQWYGLLRNDIQSQIGRSTVASWEARNFMQLANINKVLVENPNKKLMYIVGASHKPILDRYLGLSMWAYPVKHEIVFGK